MKNFMINNIYFQKFMQCIPQALKWFGQRVKISQNQLGSESSKGERSLTQSMLGSVEIVEQKADKINEMVILKIMEEIYKLFK